MHTESLERFQTPGNGRACLGHQPDITRRGFHMYVIVCTQNWLQWQGALYVAKLLELFHRSQSHGYPASTRNTAPGHLDDKRIESCRHSSIQRDINTTKIERYSVFFRCGCIPLKALFVIGGCFVRPRTCTSRPSPSLRRAQSEAQNEIQHIMPHLLCIHECTMPLGL